MDQYYIIGPQLDPATETRNLTYKYGRFVYSGSVVTEPLLGLEYLPGVLQGIQAVQGQIPYISEVRELPAESAHVLALAHVERALEIIYAELSGSLERELVELSGEGENKWLEDEDSALYFEFESLPGYTCNGADVVFAKTYRGEVMLSAIWYAHTGCFYVTLTHVGDSEQALVDTRFPAIYGKQRGVMLHSYDEDKGSSGELDEAADAAWAERMSLKAAAELEGGGGKRPDEDSSAIAAALRPAGLFARASVWLSDGEVPDPDALRARDDALAALDDGDEDDGDDEGGGAGGGKAGEEHAARRVAAAEGKRDGGGHGDSALSLGELATVDVSGGNGYTQVYIVMQPLPAGPRTPIPGGGMLTPRGALFRFGSWVYGGQVDFPVDMLRLGDVPYVLPALQKQQSRLAFLSEATAFPGGHPLCSVIADFMAAVGVLRHEMEDAQAEVAALAEHSVNAWIDADWAASFFELSFQPSSVTGRPSRGTVAGDGLAGAEVIAAKIYLYEGQGIILHCVWFAGSVFCVLSDSIEDLPLLDVAFPDVTARNRVVQVRSYEERTARKLAAAFPGAPLPKSLRVWEGRRKGVAGVGHGAASAFGGDAAGAADAIRRRAREKAEAEAAVSTAGAASAKPAGGSAGSSLSVSDGRTLEDAAKTSLVSGSASSSSGSGPSVRERLSESKRGGGEEDDEGLYDVSGLSQSLAPAARREGAAGGVGSASDTKAKSGASASAMPTQLFSSVARAPHHVAPINRGGPQSVGGGVGPAEAAEEDATAFSRNRLVLVGSATAKPASVGESDSKDSDADAPWDASGKPRVK